MEEIPTSDVRVLKYNIKDPLELNLSFMPFISKGGLYVPTVDAYRLGENVVIELQVPTKKDSIRIEGVVVWITPRNALHHVLPGVGVQFTGVNAAGIRGQIESMLDNTVDVGGYTYGITDEMRPGSK